MELSEWSTQALPGRERFEFFREVEASIVGVLAEPGDHHGRVFDGQLSRLSGSTFLRFRFTSDGHRVLRRPVEIARHPWNHYWIYREESVGAWVDAAGKECTTSPGHVMFFDTDIPFTTLPLSRYRHEVWLIPRALVEPHLPKLGGRLAIHLNPNVGAHALAADFFDVLRRRIESLSDAESECAIDVLCRLLGVACGAALPEQREAVREAKLEQAKRYIDRHLSDAALTPMQAANALGISVRSLHLLFEPCPNTFAEYVTRRRLQECRVALERSAGAPSVTDIALRWGFGSLATFYRAFRREYGFTPSDLRSAHRSTARI